MCLLCLCLLITSTHSYFSHISLCVCVSCVCCNARLCVWSWCVSQQAFPFTAMLFALVMTRLSHNLFVFVCMHVSVCVCACVFKGVTPLHFTRSHLKTSIVALNLEATHAQRNVCGGFFWSLYSDFFSATFVNTKFTD